MTLHTSSRWYPTDAGNELPSVHNVVTIHNRGTGGRPSLRTASDARGFNPLLDISTSPTAVPIAQADVMWPGGVNTPFAFGRPVVQRGDRDASHVVNFFGREHLAVGVRGDCHVDSLWLEESTVVGCPPMMRTCRNCKQSSTPLRAQLSADVGSLIQWPRRESVYHITILSGLVAPAGLDSSRADLSAATHSAKPPTSRSQPDLSNPSPNSSRSAQTP